MRPEGFIWGACVARSRILSSIALWSIEMNNSQKKLLGSAVLVGGVVASNAAQAVASTDFATALTGLTTDVGTYGAGLVALSVVGVGFGVAIKYIKKLRGAA
jgi:hypothetical protein